MNCKNCGATLKRYSNCEYCGTILNDRKVTYVDVNDMKLKEIEKLIYNLTQKIWPDKVEKYYYSDPYKPCEDVFCLFKAYSHYHSR